MSPAVPSTPWRQLSRASKTDVLTVDEHMVPKGVSVGVDFYSLHGNEEYFPEPGNIMYFCHKYLQDIKYFGIAFGITLCDNGL